MTQTDGVPRWRRLMRTLSPAHRFSCRFPLSRRHYSDGAGARLDATETQPNDQRARVAHRFFSHCRAFLARLLPGGYRGPLGLLARSA